MSGNTSGCQRNRKYIAKLIVDNPGMEPTKITLEIASGGLNGAHRRAAEILDAVAAYRGIVVNGDEGNYRIIEVEEAPNPQIKSSFGDEIAKRFGITQAAAQRISVNFDMLITDAMNRSEYLKEINAQASIMHALGAITETEKFMIYEIAVDLFKIQGHKERREALDEWRKNL